MKRPFRSSFYPIILAIAFLSGSVTACMDDPTSNMHEQEFISMLVVNEGVWGGDPGSLTGFHPESGELVSDRFQQVNGRSLGGMIQFVTLAGNRIYVVTNDIDKIEVADRQSLESIATIDVGFVPVSFVEAGADRGYVSSLNDQSVYEVDLESYTLTGTRIDVGSNPQQMAVVGDRLYVANSGYGSDNTVTVINTSTHHAERQLQVGNGPSRMEVDSENRIWVVSGGHLAYNDDFTEREPENDIPGRIDILDGDSSTVLETIETGGFPRAITLNENTSRAWVANEETVQQIDMTTFAVMNDRFIDRSFDGISYSPADNLLFLAKNNGYSQSGEALIYTPEGTAVDSFSVGIAPKDFLFLD